MMDRISVGWGKESERKEESEARGEMMAFFCELFPGSLLGITFPLGLTATLGGRVSLCTNGRKPVLAKSG